MSPPTSSSTLSLSSNPSRTTFSSSPSPAPPSFKRAHIDLKALNNGIHSIPELIEFNARENADLPFCVQTGRNDKSITISHQQLKQAIHICRQHLMKNLHQLQLPRKDAGGRYTKGAPVALFGESNIVLLIHLLTFVSMGVPVLLLSARLSPVAILRLLSETKAVAIIASGMRQIATAHALYQDDRPDNQTTPIYEPLALDDLVKGDPGLGEDTVYNTGYDLGVSDRNVVILHSSGTTGLPKAIYTSHRYLLSFTTCHDLPYDESSEQPCLSTLPLYHGFGLIAPLLSMGVGMTFCIPPSSVIPTGTSTADLLQRTQASFLISVPSILEELSLIPGAKGIQLLQNLNFVAFGGGQLKPSVGNTLSGAGVRLVNHYGTTESGPLAPLFPPGSEYDHRYFRLRQDIELKIESGPAALDGTPRFSLTTFPPGWSTPFQIQDQLVQNPACPGTDFNAVGRNDAVIVLATGEKVLPSILETELLNDERLCAVVAFGDGQFEIGVIVQPGPHVVVDSLVAFKQEIWPLIERANTDMDAQGRVSSLDLVICVPPDVALPRSDKGSIMRGEVIKQFEAEITKVYRDIEDKAAHDSTTQLNMSSLEHQLEEYIQTSLGWKIPAGQWSQDDDLFELGMDSLQALQMRRYLLGAIPPTELSTAAAMVPRDFVYTHPSVTRMTDALRGGNISMYLHNTTEKLLEHFQDVALAKVLQEEHAEPIILLTGTTGSLGAHILTKLASLPEVPNIVCLVRRQTGNHPMLRQQASLTAKGLHIPDHAWSRIEVIGADMAKPNLGLSKAWYAELQSRVTHIIHAAWPMDFKRKVHSFRDTFQTLQNLIFLTQRVHESRPDILPRLIFISSIAVVGQHHKITGDSMVAESPVPGKSSANHIGYAQAKFICERMLEQAAEVCGGHCEPTYIRVGQMSGNTQTGYWNAQEHVPALIAASRQVRKLPKLRGTLSWIPVDVAASAVLDILFTPQPLRITYHLENPTRQPWHDMLCDISDVLGLDMNSSVSMSEWVAEVGKSSDAGTQAVKLGDFFEEDFEHMACGDVALDTYQARQVSSHLRKLGPVKTRDMEKFIQGWGLA